MVEIVKVETNKKRHLPLLLLADPCEAMVYKYLDAGDMYALTANGMVACEAVVLAVSDRDVELKNLATQPECQRRGYAGALVKHLLSEYAGRYSRMLVGTSKSGVAFYERLGFSVSHIVPGFFVLNYPDPIWEDGEQAIDMIYLSRRL